MNVTEQLDAYQACGQLDADQELYSMLDRQMEATNLPKCAQDGLAFLAYSPLGQGLLTGKITADRKYPEDDQRRYKPRFQPDNIQRVDRMLEPMRSSSSGFTTDRRRSAPARAAA